MSRTVDIGNKVTTSTWNSSLSRWMPLAVLAMVASTIFFLPVYISQYGYAPLDDALAISAKITSGKSWNDILATGPEVDFERYYQPGWHFLLSIAKSVFSLNQEGLLLFSVGFAWCLAAWIPLFYFRRPEVWLACLFLFGLLDFDFIFRLFSGRSFSFSIFTLVSLLALWTPLVEERRLKLVLPTISLLVAGSVWIHGAWYLLALPLLAVALSGNWLATARFACAVGVGILVGAMLTLHPVDHLIYQVQHLYRAIFGDRALQNPVGEFKPNPVGVPVVLFCSLFLLFRIFHRDWRGTSLIHPAFLLGALGWILGLQVARFWYDWGLPSLIFWFALEIQRLLEDHVARESWQRLLFSFLLCLAFFVSLGANQNNRWSINAPLSIAYLKETQDFDTWLPGEDGMVYSNSMGVLLNFFYTFPEAHWRYVLGLEPTNMERDNLQVYGAYRENRDFRALAPWAEKLRPQDRLILISEPNRRPASTLPMLTWKFLPPQYWIGKPPNAPGN